NPTNANFQTQLRGVQDAARDLGQQVSILSANTEREIDVAFATVAQSGARALLVGSDPFFSSERDQVIALAARHAIPAIYEGREFATAGGLASYGTSLADAYRQAALYAGRILKGEKPADLPHRPAKQVRVRDQLEDCEDTWPRCVARAGSERRRNR